jgi:hypothetical protein
VKSDTGWVGDDELGECKMAKLMGERKVCDPRDPSKRVEIKFHNFIPID